MDTSEIIIYRLDLSAVPIKRPLAEGQCLIASHFKDIKNHFSLWTKNWGLRHAMKTAFKVLSGRRVFFYSVLPDGKAIQSGWANIGFCRYYPVERDAIVLGTL